MVEKTLQSRITKVLKKINLPKRTLALHFAEQSVKKGDFGYAALCYAVAGSDTKARKMMKAQRRMEDKFRDDFLNDRPNELGDIMMYTGSGGLLLEGTVYALIGDDIEAKEKAKSLELHGETEMAMEIYGIIGDKEDVNRMNALKKNKRSYSSA